MGWFSPHRLLAISNVIRKLQRENLRQMKTAAFDESRRAFRNNPSASQHTKNEKENFPFFNTKLFSVSNRLLFGTSHKVENCMCWATAVATGRVQNFPKFSTPWGSDECPQRSREKFRKNFLRFSRRTFSSILVTRYDLKCTSNYFKTLKHEFLH